MTTTNLFDPIDYRNCSYAQNPALRQYLSWLDPQARSGDDLQHKFRVEVPPLLKLLRDSGAPQKVIATGGQLQQNLPQGRTFQLLRLRLDETLGLVPEISGNRLLVSVRLMRLGEDTRLHPDNSDTQFELTLCS